MRTLHAIIILLSFSSIVAAEYNKEIQLTPVLKTDTTSIGQQLNYPDIAADEVSIVKVTIPPGKETGWHKHRFPVFAYVMQGNLTVEIDSATARQFPEGTSFAEVINTFHNGKNTSLQNVVLIAFFIGEKGSQLSVKNEKK